LELQEYSKPLLCLKIQDDGQGCDLSQINHGFGLLGIKERVKSLNGDITIQSQAGEGLTLSASIPLS
jgi:two-component system sensor histidine kinase UhpB